jgi:hypothetical protein
MNAGTRVCPFCGEPPGPGVFCAACGRSLAAVERLPTGEEWDGAQAGAAAGGERSEELAALSGDAIPSFLAAMQAVGNPGAKKIGMAKRSAFKRAGHVSGWIVRPVDREDFEQPRRYEPGLLLTVEGRFHVLDSELRGWGQRDFPHYHHTVRPEPIDPPVDDRLRAELSEILRSNGVST